MTPTATLQCGARDPRTTRTRTSAAPRRAGQPITFTSTVARGDRVEYDVDGVGIFTVAWSELCSGDGDAPEADHLAVTYGQLPDPERPRFGVLPGAPIVNRIQLIGTCTVAISDALAALAMPDARDAWWIYPRRYTPTGHVEAVPDATRARTGRIVARLVEDFLDREDAPEIWREHLTRHAARQLATHRHNIERARHEIARWNRYLAQEQNLHDLNQAIIQGEGPPDAWPEPPIRPSFAPRT